MLEQHRCLGARALGSLALVALLASALAHAETAPPIVRASTAARYLRPGDTLLNFVRTTNPAFWAKAIVGAQKGIQKLAGFFNKSLRLADPSIVHSAIYLGDGMIAEAYGTNPDDAGVAVVSLDQHPSETYLISRPVDSALAKRAATIAKLWAQTKRLGYFPPFHAPLRSSSFGSNARAAALSFGKAAAVSGGPASVTSMFCSQFVIAVYQAAIVAPQLAKNPKLSADRLTMPRALAVDAGNASPLAQVGALRSKEDNGKLLFVEHGKVQVDPTLPPRPGIYDWVKAQFKKFFN